MSSDITDAATADKRLAQAARKEGNLPRATALIQRAIARLEALRPQLDAVKPGVLSEENRKLAETLTDVLGSCGGIYRSAGEWELSIAAYDAGFLIEQDPRFGFVNSYNLTQRLVARVLYEPAGWIVAGRSIQQERFPECLQKARDVVDRQTRGPRKDDAWAWADLGMLQLLCEEGTDQAWDGMIDKAREAGEPYVFSSTLNVLSDLKHRLEAADSTDALAERPRLSSRRRAIEQAMALMRDSASGL